MTRVLKWLAAMLALGTILTWIGGQGLERYTWSPVPCHVEGSAVTGARMVGILAARRRRIVAGAAVILLAGSAAALYRYGPLCWSGWQEGYLDLLPTLDLVLAALAWPLAARQLWRCGFLRRRSG